MTQALTLKQIAKELNRAEKKLEKDKNHLSLLQQIGGSKEKVKMANLQVKADKTQIRLLSKRIYAINKNLCESLKSA